MPTQYKTKGFRGNKKIKTRGVQIQWTERMISEFTKCKEDIFYFIKNYYKIVAEDGLISMVLYDYQYETISSMVNNRFTMMVQSRQSGKSEAFRAFVIWYILFHDYKTIAIVADKEKTANEMISKIQLSYEQLPMWMQQGVVEFNKSSIILENESRVFASATSTSSLVGFTTHIIIVDEAALIENWSDFYGAVRPTISAGTNTKLIMASCVVDDTYVFSSEGIRQLKDFIDYEAIESPKIAYNVTEHKILGKNGFNTGHYLMNSGLVPTKKISLTHSEIECSLPHKLYCFKNGKYDFIESKDISVGDYVAVKYNQNIWKNDNSLEDIKLDYTKALNKFVPKKEIDENLSYFLGLYLAEGYTQNTHKKNRTVISCGDNISYALDPLGLKYYCNDGIHYQISSKSLCDFIEKFGFDINLKAKNKVIPQRIMNMSPNLVAKFLSGFFDGDGHISKSRELISVTSASEKLINQIRIILMNLGIISTKSSGVTPPTEKVCVSSQYYKLEISSKHYHKFNKIIGFSLPRKKNLIKKEIIHRHGSSKDIIPNAFELLKKYNIKISRSGQKINKNNLSRDFCLTIPGIELVKEFISEDLVWSRVNEIKDSENKVYDFSLDDIPGDPWCHSIIYNGIVGHQTPRGLNHYYDFFQGSDLGEGERRNSNGFKAFYIPWDRVPGRDEKWKENELASLNYDYAKFAQEYACEWLGSSGTLVSGDTLKSLQKKTRVPVMTLENENLKIYEHPIKEVRDFSNGLDKIVSPAHIYVMNADVSRGKGLDYSAFSVFDVTHIPYKQVCTYRSNQISPTDYAEIVNRVSHIYNNSHVLVEINDIGDQVGSMLLTEYALENMICSETAGRAGKRATYFTSKSDKGIKTSAPIKNSGCLLLKLLLEQGKLHIPDQETVNELTTFSKVKETYKAEKGKHDDLAMTLVLFAWLSDQGLFEDITSINTFNALNEKTSEEFDDQFEPAFGSLVLGDRDLFPGWFVEKVHNMNTPWNPQDIYGMNTSGRWDAVILPDF